MDFLCFVLLSICDIEGSCDEEMYVEDQMGSLRHKKQEDNLPSEVQRGGSGLIIVH